LQGLRRHPLPPPNPQKPNRTSESGLLGSRLALVGVVRKAKSGNANGSQS
jgi:hypothetical protein